MALDPRDWASPLPLRWPDRIRAIAAPILLVGVAVLGVHRTMTLEQSSWQGASFGMFATYDNRASRIVRLTVDTGSGPRRALIPEDLQDDALRLRVVPTEDAAQRLARATLRRVAQGPATVDVEVWRIQLEAQDGTLRLRLEPLVAARAAR